MSRIEPAVLPARVAPAADAAAETGEWAIVLRRMENACTKVPATGLRRKPRVLSSAVARALPTEIVNVTLLAMIAAMFAAALPRRSSAPAHTAHAPSQDECDAGNEGVTALQASASPGQGA